MSSEIERKFLLGELPSWLADRAGEPISQGYLTSGGGAEIRLRRAGERTLLTVKTGAGEVREEVEVDLDEGLFDSLWPLTEGRRIEKTRLRAPLTDGLEAEVDVYDGDLAGLVVAEVEFDSVGRCREFGPPSWMGTEVSGDPRYANRSLATAGAPPTADPAPAPSSSFRLKRREEVSEGVRRIVRARAGIAAETLEDDNGDPATAIHSARKDLKKIRSTLRLVRAELGETTYKAENKRYREAGRALSGSRDAAVRMQTLESLERHFGREFPSAAAATWRGQLEAESEKAGAAAGPEAEATREAIGAIAAAQAAVETWQLAGDSWGLLGPGLGDAYRRGRKTMAAVAADPDPELVHEWRKRAKDLWYQLRLIRHAWPGPLEANVDSAHDLADLLGDHHDLTLLGEDLAGRGDVEGPTRARVAELIERRQAELIDAALDLGGRLYAEKPKQFARRMRAYWSAWRDA
ncbi:MAG TPA: CHAD domain-containing protein [Solirubrobacterales bacterium]|jgi:CYTH domain-containing protein/CHAD domain-containing protein|nr:CHAD domain-containing protein [Solirubrobacterales bacterium]